MNEQNYYKKRNNDFYTKYTKKEIWQKINPKDPLTIFPFLREMDYPYIAEQWDRYVKRYNPSDGEIIGRYISLMRLTTYKKYTWDDSMLLNEYNKRRTKMYQIIDYRNSGKTSRLMLLAQEHDGVLVCSNPYAMRKKAEDYGLKGFDIISYYDYWNNNYNVNKKCFIDELDSFVASLGNKLSGYSLSLED